MILKEFFRDRISEFLNFILQKGVIRGQFLGIQHMGWSHGGTGGAIVNVASLAGVRCCIFK